MAYRGARAPSHAGSWYSADDATLDADVASFLRGARPADDAAAAVDDDDGARHPRPHPSPSGRRAPRALIVPHAGFSYSGPAAGWGYVNVAPAAVDRVFLLGPSHHVFLRGCALTAFATYATPIGDLEIDRETCDALLARTPATLPEDDDGRNPPGPAFVRMDAAVDEAEHSLEMHLPFIRKLFSSRDGDEEKKATSPTSSPVSLPPVKLVPVLVGALTVRLEKFYGEALAPYLDDPRNLFVVSTDFCHWGRRFGYTPWAGEAEGTPLHESIERLDRRGMRTIEAKDAEAFAAYLAETRNTICGRHPLGVFLRALERSRGFRERAIQFTRYEQSGRAEGYRDSSVSYASAVVF